MTCRQCKFEFCWICMGPWTDHGASTGGYYKCNKYDPAAPTKDEQDGAKAKAEVSALSLFPSLILLHSSFLPPRTRRGVRTTEALILLPSLPPLPPSLPPSSSSTGTCTTTSGTTITTRPKNTQPSKRKRSNGE